MRHQSSQWSGHGCLIGIIRSKKLALAVLSKPGSSVDFVSRVTELTWIFSGPDS